MPEDEERDEVRILTDTAGSMRLGPPSEGGENPSPCCVRGACLCAHLLTLWLLYVKPGFIDFHSIEYHYTCP